MFPENMKSFIDMATMIGDLQKRVERLETLEHTNFGMGCWRVLDRDSSGQFTSIPNNSPDYPSLAILYNVKRSADPGVNLLMRWNNISTATYENTWVDLTSGVANVTSNSGQTSAMMGKCPPNHYGIFWASGIIFWPMVQRGPEVPVFGINASIDFSQTASNRLSVGLYSAFNTGYTWAPVTDIKFSLSAGAIRAGSYFVLYEICDILNAEGGA